MDFKEKTQTKLTSPIWLIGGLLVVSTQVAADLIAEGRGVYDTQLNVTWTQDANLLATMENGNPDLISQIIAANNGVINDTPNGFDTPPDSGVYNLSAADFSSGGATSWWGAQAFVGYLNSIDYDGSAQWRLPYTPADATLFGDLTGNELGELYYGELGGPTGYNNNTVFSNTNTPNLVYWSETEYTADYLAAWAFSISSSDGFQAYYGKAGPFYTWAVSPGNVSTPIPLPSAVWQFAAALLGLCGLHRNRVARR